MEPREYQTLFEVEGAHWWFRALRDVLRDVCLQLGFGPQTRLLDAGCGTGQAAAYLRQAVTPQVYGFDLSPHALRFWPQRHFSRACQASINAIPFADGAFDGAISVDVLECDGVDDRRACQELLRVVRPDGYLILVVPAYRWLYSPAHHRAVHASRRYSKPQIQALLHGLPVRVIRTTHLFATLLPPIAVYRGLRRLTDWMSGDASPRSELSVLPGTVNHLLYRAVDWERRWLGKRDLPFGSSLLMIAKKTGLP